ncbi:hypothetical protein [Methylobacterium aerolatum]|uniref:Uncharacterized protein n=1 Tax=Methylobacterium aerolatum TaxID=418708 RepID=A0ABU0HXA2_9HYPH|nr:hypothetical protein [Methylobacterium aerolatum]MDQ0446975.1 hypothetical protein [Methylobacterium aerolatum]GJD36766.1 hypothetical protein FMGBMHLM_3689 [Methylobacterium aerolatum]
MATTKPDTTEATVTPAVPVIEIPPVDPGDAHGVGNIECTPVRPDLLHETAEKAEARWLAWQSAGVR